MNVARLGPALVGLAVVVGACTSPISEGPPIPESPSSSTAPSPTPVGAVVASQADAAALVIATDPRFAGAMRLSPDLIGSSKWWDGADRADGGYDISLTIGWGDCPAGCINHHTWTFTVTEDGVVALVEETGDPVPPNGLPTGDT